MDSVGFKVIQDRRMGSNPQQLHQSKKHFLLLSCSSWTSLNGPFALAQELEKSKPVVLTGDLNCAHEEIDIFNPAVTKLRFSPSLFIEN